MAIGIGSWDGEFEIVERFSQKRAPEVWFESREQLGDHLLGKSAEVVGDGSAIHLGEALVDADIAQIAVEKQRPTGAPS